MDKVNNVIYILKDMTFINKLRFGVCAFSSNYLNLKYDKNKYYKQYDGLLREWDDEYSKSFLDARKYPIILFVLAKMMEMNEGEKNQVIMWFINNI